MKTPTFAAGTIAAAAFALFASAAVPAQTRDDALLEAATAEKPAVVATLEEVADAKRLSPRSRGAVTAADFAALKRRWRCRTYASRDAYLAHPAIRMDMRAWALSELSHIPLPGMDTGAGLAATQLADALEAWLNARRWPVEIGRKRMPAILREMGFGVRNGRWNCAWRTLPAKA